MRCDIIQIGLQTNLNLCFAANNQQENPFLDKQHTHYTHTHTLCHISFPVSFAIHCPLLFLTFLNKNIIAQFKFVKMKHYLFYFWITDHELRSDCLCVRVFSLLTINVCLKKKNKSKKSSLESKNKISCKTNFNCAVCVNVK